MTTHARTRLLGLTTILVVMGLHLASPLLGPEPNWGDLAFAVVLAGGYLAVGAVILVKTSAQPVAWLLLGIGVVFGIAETENPLLPPWFGTWIALWIWLAAFTLMAWLTMAFPSGRLPPGRGAWPAACRSLLAVMALLVPAVALIGEGVGSAAGEHMPFGFVPTWVATFAPVVVIVGLVAGAASLFVRLRHSEGVARLQLRWVATSLALIAITVGITIAIIVVIDVLGEPYTGDEIWGPAALSFLTLPLAFLVATTRYRLYEIDRVISRTVTYTIVAGLIAGTYVVGVVGVQAVLPVSGDLTVAGSTLVVAALFHPMRRRVHRMVDRRFNRSRYRAEAVLDGFSARVRDAIGVDVITRDVLDVVNTTLQPASVALWTPPAAR